MNAPSTTTPELLREIADQIDATVGAITDAASLTMPDRQALAVRHALLDLIAYDILALRELAGRLDGRDAP